MTFLFVLLSSLYEPEENEREKRCVFHPLHPRPYLNNEYAAYCADMNIALAYHKGLDDWHDDRNPTGRMRAKMLKNAYQRVVALYPETCEGIQACLRTIGGLEKSGAEAPDAPVNLTARMLGLIFCYREDNWSDTMREMGEALGRFIYFMDAYDDLAVDIRRKRYNPLREHVGQEDYEAFCMDSLMLLIAEAANAFETLPLIRDVDLLRNILYAGVWSRYEQRHKKSSKGMLMPKGGKK